MELGRDKSSSITYLAETLQISVHVTYTMFGCLAALASSIDADNKTSEETFNMVIKTQEFSNALLYLLLGVNVGWSSVEWMTRSVEEVRNQRCDEKPR